MPYSHGHGLFHAYSPMLDKGKRFLIFAHAVAGDTADSINMLTFKPEGGMFDPKVV